MSAQPVPPRWPSDRRRLDAGSYGQPIVKHLTNVGPSKARVEFPSGATLLVPRHLLHLVLEGDL